MMKRIAGVVLVGALSIGFTGCLGESDSVSCSGETVSELVEEISMPIIKEELFIKLLNNKGMANGMLYQSVKAMAEFSDKEINYNDTVKGYDAAKAELEKEFEKSNFILTDIRTTAKEKEINKVVCMGKATVKTPNYTVSYDLEYNAQLGDKKENVYVEITRLN
ncbi:MAG: hypothetical protein WA945_03445 [Arcobacteraceae bacterium]